MALAVSRPTQQVGTADLRKRITAGLRELSGQIGVDLPGMTTPQHLIDAARAVEHNNLPGAGRHLDLAVHTLTPQSLYRHGHTDDDAHAHAKAAMYGVARHDLLVKDLQDAHDHNVNADNISAQARQQRQDARQQAAPGPAQASVKLANARRALELGGTSWMHQHRDSRGRWDGGSGLAASKAPKFTHGGEPGSWEHARAIKALGEQFVPGGELSIPYAVSPEADTIKNALFNAARAMVMRRMDVAGVHMDMAVKAARRLGPAQVALVRSARASLDNVPKGAQQMHHELPAYDFNRPDINKSETYVPAYGMGFANRVDLSANTARLAATPAPLGKPGGPGLYNVKGGKHSDYMEQIVKALIEKRGMDKDRAYKIAYGALRKWQRGGGKVHPEVRAAAGSALAEEKAKGAAARASHGHSSMIAAVELAAQQQQQQQAQSSGGWNSAAHPRAAAGSPAGGQFAKGGGQQSGTSGKKGGSQHLGKAPGKAALLRQAKADRERAQALRAQLIALIAVLHGHQPKSSQRNARSGSSAPAKKGAGAQSSKQAATNSASGTSKPGKTTVSKAPPKMTTAQMQARVIALRTQIKTLLAQAQADTRAAAKA